MFYFKNFKLELNILASSVHFFKKFKFYNNLQSVYDQFLQIHTAIIIVNFWDHKEWKPQGEYTCIVFYLTVNKCTDSPVMVENDRNMSIKIHSTDSKRICF
jgi:hypothetical protein